MSRLPFPSRTLSCLPGVSRRRPTTLSSCPGLPSPVALPAPLPGCPASAAAAPRPCLHVPASLHLSHPVLPARRQPPPPHDPVFMSRPPFTSRTARPGLSAWRSAAAAPRPCLHVPASLHLSHRSSRPVRLAVSRRRPTTLSSCPGLPSPLAPLVPACPPGGHPPPPHDPVFMSRPPFTSRTARPGLSAWRSAAAAPRSCLHVPASLHLSHSLSACPPARRQPPPPHDPVFMSRPPFARRSCSSRPVRLAVSRRRPTILSSCPGLPSPLALPVRLPACPASAAAAP